MQEIDIHIWNEIVISVFWPEIKIKTPIWSLNNFIQI